MQRSVFTSRASNNRLKNGRNKNTRKRKQKTHKGNKKSKYSLVKPSTISLGNRARIGLELETTCINRLYPLTISLAGFRFRFDSARNRRKRDSSSLIIIMANELKSPRIILGISASSLRAPGIKTRQTTLYFYCLRVKGAGESAASYNYARVTHRIKYTSGPVYLTFTPD